MWWPSAPRRLDVGAQREAGHHLAVVRIRSSIVLLLILFWSHSRNGMDGGIGFRMRAVCAFVLPQNLLKTCTEVCRCRRRREVASKPVAGEAGRSICHAVRIWGSRRMMTISSARSAIIWQYYSYKPATKLQLASTLLVVVPGAMHAYLRSHNHPQGRLGGGGGRADHTDRVQGNINILKACNSSFWGMYVV